MARQAVALVPGFLGFDHRRGTTYFADRFVAGLRARLEAACGAPFPVVPVTTSPVGSLAARQERLLADLAKLDFKLGYPRWHLLGHSTGGVDCALLTRTHRLKRSRAGSVFSREPLRIARLASITTVAAPHYGTGLARSPLARVVRGQPTPAGFEGALRLGLDALQRDNWVSRVEFVLPSLLHNSKFYWNFFSNALATDLDPGVVGALTMTENIRDEVPITSFATYAPPPNLHDKDRLFADLHRWTREGALGVPPPPSAFPELFASNVIASSPDIPLIDAGSNDAVVTTNRQVYEGGVFGGLIVGDHGDVIGRYRRIDPLDRGMIDPGLLTSGANFGDEQFFAVLERIAESIARTARSAQGALHAAE